MSGNTLSGAELVEIRLIKLETIISPEFLYFLPVWFSMRAVNFLNMGKVLLFYLKK